MTTTPTSKSQKRRLYPKEFKQSAVRLAAQVGTAQAAKDLGIAAAIIRSWRKAEREEGADAFRGQGHRTALEAELERLRRENRTSASAGSREGTPAYGSREGTPAY